jgi:NAD+ synthase
MTTLYAVAAMEGGRVINTSNASEIYVGYSTKWGDSVGDVSLFKNLTSEEVCAIGIELGLPADLVYKAPSDGMSGLTDEDNLGFKYRCVNAIIRHSDNDICDYQEIQKKHRYSEHKRLPMPAFEPVFEQEISLEEITEERTK